MRQLALGVAVVLAACGSSHRNDPNVDAPIINCMPEGANQCSGASWQTCQDGNWVTTIDCTDACADMIGCVQCYPGTQFCKDGNVVACDSTGTPGQVVQMCVGAETCSNAVCVNACNDAAANRSYIACEYWAVDLDNLVEPMQPTGGSDLLTPIGGSCDAYGIPGMVPATLPVCIHTQGPFTKHAGRCDPAAGGNTACPTGYTCNPTQPACVLDAQHAPFGIVVSNPQARDVNVTVTGAGGQQIMQTIAAGQVVAIKPQDMGAIPDQSVEYSTQVRAAYKITSDLPIVAYQFNPLDNVNVFSNDASLLIPRTSWDINYYVTSWPTIDRRDTAQNVQSYFGYFTVVAYMDGTQISVTPTAPIQASATQATIAAGATATFTLNAFDVLQLEASGSGDLSGTFITSPNMVPFGVFGGHDAAEFGETTPPDAQHTVGPCCADHLEEMLFPSSTWGKTFAIARSQQRTNEPDYLRIMAQKPNTSVTFDPAPSAVVSGDCTMLQPGGFCDVKIQGDTEISASDPVLVGHFLESSIWQNTARTSVVGNGDPSMAIAVPAEQYRTDYTILIPNSYMANYLSISAALTGAVTVDGNPVTLTAFPSATPMHRSARVPVIGGQHTIHCPDTCGVLVYGFSDAVSYMFAGGLDLKQIVIQ